MQEVNSLLTDSGPLPAEYCVEIAEFVGLEFAALKNDGLENDGPENDGLDNDGVGQEQTYAFKVIRVLFEGIGASVPCGHARFCMRELCASRSGRGW